MADTKHICSIALGLLLAVAYHPASRAIPINDNTLNQNGALFTIEGEWLNPSTYQLTYWANFDGFDNGGGEDFLQAIDWKWQGGMISAITLLGAPGDLSDWSARAFQQISYGETVGCADGGGFSAVCTEYVGDGLGLSTSVEGDLRWVFEVSFKDVRQQELLLGRGPRAGYLGGGGDLAAPLGITATGLPAELIDGQVPVPGVLPLVLIGLLGLIWQRGVFPMQGTRHRP